MGTICAPFHESLYFVSRLRPYVFAVRNSRLLRKDGAVRLHAMSCWHTYFMTPLLQLSCWFSSPLSVSWMCEWLPPMVDTLSVRQYSQLYCFSQHDSLHLERRMQLACCTLRQMKAELRMYFWTVVKHSSSKQCLPPERHHHHDVTHLKSETFSIFSVWMDSDLPDGLFGLVKTQEGGKGSWLMCTCAWRQIDQPVAVPQWGYLCRKEKIAGLYAHVAWPYMCCTNCFEAALDLFDPAPPPSQTKV